MSTPFEPGAAPAGFIPLCVPEIRGNAWDAIKQCLDSNWVSSAGPYVDRFEHMVAAWAGTQHAVAVSSGTAALHTALLVTGIQPDDEVLVPALTFIASANAVRHAGAWPVFIDVEPTYWQIDPAKVREFLSQSCVWRAGALYNRTSGRRVRGIMPVHVLGHPVDMDPLLEAARSRELIVIEDAAEAIGARYKDRPIGKLGDIACFSFNGNKIITTGGGGMVVTDNQQWADRARYLTTQAKDDPLEYVHGAVGYNYRLTNLQAALGCSQVELLQEFLDTKRRIAAHYTQAFASVPGLTPMLEAPWAQSTHWLYTVLVDEKRFGMGSRALLRKLAEARIQTRPLWQPLHRSPCYADLPPRQCPVADRLHRDALSLPCSVGLREAQEQVIAAIQGLATSQRLAS